MEGNALIAVGAALAIGMAALGGTLGQGKAAAAALEGIARNPEAQGKIFTPMLLAMALIESLVILGFVIAISIALLTISYRTIQSVRTNPALTLRYE